MSEPRLQYLVACMRGGPRRRPCGVARVFGVLMCKRANRLPGQPRSEARANIGDAIERGHNPRHWRKLTVRHQKDPH